MIENIFLVDPIQTSLKILPAKGIGQSTSQIVEGPIVAIQVVNMVKGRKIILDKDM